MSFRRLGWILSIAAVLPMTPLLADDLGGQDTFLCAVLEASRCLPEEGCGKVALSELNIPDFIVIDLAAKSVRTTAASGENRATPIGTVLRQDGWIYLQGVEQGRAWSFVLEEESGRLNAAVARGEFAVAAFAVCTPQPNPRPSAHP